MEIPIPVQLWVAGLDSQKLAVQHDEVGQLMLHQNVVFAICEGLVHTLLGFCVQPDFRVCQLAERNYYAYDFW